MQKPSIVLVSKKQLKKKNAKRNPRSTWYLDNCSRNLCRRRQRKWLTIYFFNQNEFNAIIKNVKKKSLFEFLEEKGWKGIVLLDDIGPQWPEIEDFWNRITYPKLNVTEVGHMSGTGLVNFDEKHTISWL